MNAGSNEPDLAARSRAPIEREPRLPVRNREKSVLVSSEELLPFSLARHLVPPGRSGRPRSPSTIWRWASKGIKGRKLRFLRVGGVAYTCERWLVEFWSALAEPEDGAAGRCPLTSSPATTELDRRLVEEAERDLRDLGMET